MAVTLWLRNALTENCAWSTKQNVSIYPHHNFVNTFQKLNMYQLICLPGCNGALVGEVSGDPSLVLGSSPPDEGGVENEPVLRSVSSCLQDSEKSFLCAEDLNCASRVLGQIGQGP